MGFESVKKYGLYTGFDKPETIFHPLLLTTRVIFTICPGQILPSNILKLHEDLKIGALG
jgi:hypothetical protein